jgi:hypothetical protein
MRIDGKVWIWSGVMVYIDKTSFNISRLIFIGAKV